MISARLILVVILAASSAACVTARAPNTAPTAYAAVPPPGLILGVQ